MKKKLIHQILMIHKCLVFYIHRYDFWRRFKDVIQDKFIPTAWNLICQNKLHNWITWHLVLLYREEKPPQICKKWFANRVVSVIKKGISIVLASLILMVEEIKHIYHYYKNCNKIQRLSERKERFSDLSTLEKTEVRCFYDAKIRQLDGAQRLICRESSIQVVLQLILILYQANLYIFV